MIVITIARKPIPKGVVDNVVKWGTGGLNIDESREKGRFPNNVIFEQGESVEQLDEQSGVRKSSGIYHPVNHYDKKVRLNRVVNFGGKGVPSSMYDDTGGASRYFKQVKPK